MVGRDPDCSGAVVSHPYTVPGDYTVTLTGTNGCSGATVTHVVTVVPVPWIWQLYLPLLCDPRCQAP